MRKLSSSASNKENKLFDNFRPTCPLGKRKVAIIKDMKNTKNPIETVNESTRKENILETNTGDENLYEKLVDFVNNPIFVPTFCVAILATSIPIGLYCWYKK